MDRNNKLGATQSASVRVLPPVEFDFARGQPVPSGLGKTHIPVRQLPELSGELSPPAIVTLTLWLRPEATPAAVGADLFAVWKALDEYDRDQQGAGLRPGEVHSESTAEGEVIRLVLALAGPGVIERGARLCDAVNALSTTNSPWSQRSFVKLSADSTAA